MKYFIGFPKTWLALDMKLLLVDSVRESTILLVHCRIIKVCKISSEVVQTHWNVLDAYQCAAQHRALLVAMASLIALAYSSAYSSREVQISQ